jgi:hypothetical protein
MARTLREVIAAVPAERRAKIAAAHRQKLIAEQKERQLEEAKRVMELDRNLIAIAVIINFPARWHKRSGPVDPREAA